MTSDSSPAPAVENLADHVRSAAATSGDRPAIRSGTTTLTWAALDAQVDAVAIGLTRFVAEHGDMEVQASNGSRSRADAGTPVAARVAIALPNIPEFVVTYFAALRAGLVAVPVNPELTRRELLHVLTDCQAAVLVATPAVHEALAGAEHPATARFSVGSEADGSAGMLSGGPAGMLSGGSAGVRQFADLLAAGTAGSGPVAPVAGGDRLAALLYTAGTGGEPKAAMLTHRALLANQAQLTAIDPTPVGPDDTVLLAVPLSHAYGLNAGLGALAYHGACGFLVEHFDPAATLELIERHRVTVLLGVPSMYVTWTVDIDRTAAAFAGVRLAVSGSAALDPRVAAAFAAATGVPLHQGYGLTETAPVLTSTLMGGAGKAGSIGRPLPGVELRLVDTDGVVLDIDDAQDEEEAGSPGTDPGQIVVRGANLFSGYWPDGAGGPDPEGWWATGDIAYADGDGDLFLVDRIGEQIIVNGFNVYPYEVERVLQAHPAVAAAAVVGRPHPVAGQTVVGYVVRVPGSTAGTGELQAYCGRNLARFKCPAEIIFVEDLPRTATGKVRKTQLGEGEGPTVSEVTP